MIKTSTSSYSYYWKKCFEKYIHEIETSNKGFQKKTRVFGDKRYY